MKVIVSSHSQLAMGLKETLAFIGSGTEDIEFVILDSSGVENFEKKCNSILENHQNEEVIVFVDIFGGTPYNTFARSFLEKKIHGEIITGFNLHMILQALSSDSIEEFIEELKEDNGIKIYSEELTKLHTNNDEDE